MLARKPVGGADNAEDAVNFWPSGEAHEHPLSRFILAAAELRFLRRASFQPLQA